MPYFVPLGIPDFNGKSERGFFRFAYEIENDDATELTIEIRNGGTPLYEEKITDPAKLSQGEHIWEWDGFDCDGILDTQKLTQAKSLNFYVVAKDSEGDYERTKTDFKASYDEVEWVDVKINKNTKRIDVTLRVNLKDGGAIGIECTEQVVAPDPIIIKECPWEKVPEEVIARYGHSPIKTSAESKSFEELKNMALEGVNKYWSRHQGNIGEGVEINGEQYEVFVNAVNTDDASKSLNDIPLIYNTNNPWSRSGNTGGVYKDNNLDDKVMSLLPNGLVQRISYNDGYIQRSDWGEYPKDWSIYKNKGWEFNKKSSEDDEFKFTSAHEIGHEVLQAYGSTVYSWQHKGTSYYFPQNTKPAGKESFVEEYVNFDFMEEVEGENYPLFGEIDLMKYYNKFRPSDFYKRVATNSKDVLSLLWLTKLELK